jgi:hypothetical protein
MDKVRAFLRVVWQQRFWVLSVVGVLIAFVCWMMASGSLEAEFAANQTKINGKFSDMDGIARAEFHGNAEVNERNKKEAGEIRKKVLALWQKLYDEQRDKVLKWPREALGDEFADFVENKKFQDPINNPKMQQVYWNYIKQRFDALVDIVHAKKMKEGEMGAGFSGAEGSFNAAAFNPQTIEAGAPGAVGLPPEDPYIVQWVDQNDLRTHLTFATRPSSLRIWVTQEDLWVYENLLHAINNTNVEKNATRPDNAAIKFIIQLDVGREAALAMRERGNIIMPAAAAGGGMEAGGPEGAGGPGAGREGMDPGAMGMEGGVEGEGADPDAALLNYRYVDQQGAAIPDSSAGLGTEYRRLPIRMKLYMDQRWIPKILVECANAPLPVEVQRLRINAGQSGAGFDGSMMGGGGPGMGGGYGREGGASFAPGGGMQAAGVNSEFAEVDIQGLVYIFNQPDAAALAVPGEEGAAAPETVASAGQ